MSPPARRRCASSSRATAAWSWTLDDLCVVAYVPPFCGDGERSGGEMCDDGVANSNARPDACRLDCRPARCGDGVLDSGELCDDGNALGADGCDPSCQPEAGTAEPGAAGALALGAVGGGCGCGLAGTEPAGSRGRPHVPSGTWPALLAFAAVMAASSRRRAARGRRESCPARGGSTRFRQGLAGQGERGWGPVRGVWGEAPAWNSRRGRLA
ncbi:MAG: hypothetical protein HY744_06850 [Deltaproteobacteria bacterium]|nr:hypothetical protein [Deltaproteobacteria bacterium]